MCCSTQLQASLTDAQRRIGALEDMVRTLVGAVQELVPNRDFSAHIEACSARMDASDQHIRQLEGEVTPPDDLLR